MSDDIYLTEFYIMPVEGLATLRKEMTGLVDEDVAGGVLFRYGYRSGYEIMKNLSIITFSGRLAKRCGDRKLCKVITQPYTSFY